MGKMEKWPLCPWQSLLTSVFFAEAKRRPGLGSAHRSQLLPSLLLHEPQIKRKSLTGSQTWIAQRYPWGVIKFSCWQTYINIDAMTFLIFFFLKDMHSLLLNKTECFKPERWLDWERNKSVWQEKVIIRSAGRLTETNRRSNSVI